MSEEKSFCKYDDNGDNDDITPGASDAVRRAYGFHWEYYAHRSPLWAQRIAKQAGDDDAKIRIMFVEALGRPPSDAQLASARHFLTENAKSADRWQDLAHTLYNMKAFLYLN